MARTACFINAGRVKRGARLALAAGWEITQRFCSFHLEQMTRAVLKAVLNLRYTMRPNLKVMEEM